MRLPHLMAGDWVLLRILIDSPDSRYENEPDFLSFQRIFEALLS